MQIEAKIIAHSVSPQGKQIVTWELVYPRIIHSEFMTHRLFSRNAASSRAIPIEKMLEIVRNNPAMPVRFGANQAGMQDKGVEHDGLIYHAELCEFDMDTGKLIGIPGRKAWEEAAKVAASWAHAFACSGYHKQIGNRLTEPFQWMKTVMTATEHDNWFWLRDHKDADPTIAALAKAMWEALQASTPVELESGDWHTPYYGEGFWRDCGYVNGDMEALHYKRDSESTLENALAISSSCCAQVSYRKLDDTLEKALSVYARLVESEPVHASPFEHQATPIAASCYHSEGEHEDDGFNLLHPQTWQNGVTHIDRKGSLWSGNFCGWIQHRQLIPNNVCNNYTPSGVKE